MKYIKYVSKNAENQVPDTFPVHHPLVGSLSLDGPSTDKFLRGTALERPKKCFKGASARLSHLCARAKGVWLDTWTIWDTL